MAAASEDAGAVAAGAVCAAALVLAEMADAAVVEGEATGDAGSAEGAGI